MSRRPPAPVSPPPAAAEQAAAAAGRPHVPTLDEVIAAGYPPDVAPNIVARQQALADAFDAAAAALLPAVPDGHVTLTAPEGAASCSVAGVEYPVVDGHVVVPAEAAAPLAPLGFRLPGA